MASRRRSREYALQALFQADLATMDAMEALSGLWSGMLDEDRPDGARTPESEEVEFAQRLVIGVRSKGTALDEMIEECSTNWRVSRMPLVDRNILRMACLELTDFSDVPATVTINEAVELAKKYGTAESRAFVNGIADRLARKLGRLPSATRSNEG